MLCLQISINGRIVLTAGHDRAEHVTASVEVLPEDGAVALGVDGLACLETSSHDFLMWPAPAIRAGDEVSIRLVETDKPDRPSIARAGEGSIDEAPPAGPICAFCGKAHYEVQTMVASNRAYICGDCIELLYGEFAKGRPEV
jgi:hypothetical protein